MSTASKTSTSPVPESPAAEAKTSFGDRLIPPIERNPRILLRDTAILLLAGVVLPNLFFALAGSVWTLPRPWVNLDYFWIIALYPWLGRKGYSAAFGFIVLVDFMVAGASRFHGGAGALLDSIPELKLLPWTRIVPLAAIVIGAGLLAGWIAWRLTRRVHRRMGANIIIALVGWAVVALAPLPARVGTDSVYVGSPFFAQIAPVWVAPMLYENHGVTNSQIPSASAPIFHALDAHRPLPRRIVLVVMESWGSNPVLDSLQTKVLDTPGLRARYAMTRGTVPFDGSTVMGEMRELCHAQVGSVALDPALLPGLACLPARLASKGYKTIGFHGYNGGFFHRYTWWPVLGLKERWFAADIEKVGKPALCGTGFRGICDDDIRQMIATKLETDKTDPLFIYWMTLNAHEPMPEPDSTKTTFACATAKVTANSSDICQISRLQDIVLRGVASMAAIPGLDSTAFIMVGDHAPPLPMRSDRNKYSQTDVPFVVLWPRDVPR